MPRRGFLRKALPIVAAAFLLAEGATAPATAQGGWELLGQRAVAQDAPRSVIALPRARAYTAVRICALRNDAPVRGMEIVFGNGESQSARFSGALPARACTRAVDLAGAAPRRIRRIVVRYGPIEPRGARPVVQVFGR